MFTAISDYTKEESIHSTDTAHMYCTYTCTLEGNFTIVNDSTWPCAHLTKIT